MRRTVRRGYRYQEFEYSKTAAFNWFYPREAPNTSYFPQFQLGNWLFWGWGREEVWIDRDERRYQTTWQLFRKTLLWLIPLCYIFPFGVPGLWYKEVYSEYGEKAWLTSVRIPFDHGYIEWGGNVLDQEWLRHIHTDDSV